jgi:hypothetical protein
MIAIPDGSYIIEKNDSKTLYGEAYLISNGKIRKISDNDKFIQIDYKNKNIIK